MTKLIDVVRIDLDGVTFIAGILTHIGSCGGWINPGATRCPLT
jgi:hypothetical protein